MATVDARRETLSEATKSKEQRYTGGTVKRSEPRNG